MRQRQDSGPTLEIDEPFELSSTDLEEFRPATLLPPKLNTPGGREELVDPSWLEEQTVIMSRDELENLLQGEKLVRELTQSLHTRPTVRSMQAVMPPSQRPDPVVEVVDSQGRPVPMDQVL